MNRLSYRKWPAWTFFILLIIFANVIVYFNTLDNGFVWDDHRFIVNNTNIRSIQNIPRFFINAQLTQARGEPLGIIYRPLRTASFAIDYQLSGLKPFGYHLTSLILHILTSVVVFLLANMLLQRPVGALFAALVFAIHPIQTESVDWISSQGDIICGLFFFLSLLLYFTFRRKDDSKQISYLILSVLTYLIALLGKEMAITLPLLIILIDILFFNQKSAKAFFKDRIKIYLPYWAISIIYVLLRTLILGAVRQREFWGGSIWATFFTMCRGVVYYLRALLFPVGLSSYHDFPLSYSFFAYKVILSFLLIIGLILLAILIARRNPLISFAVLFFFITLIPVSNIFPIMVTMIAERFLYIPVFSLCLLVGYLVTVRRFLVAPAVVLIIVYGVLTVKRNEVWQDRNTLWSDVLKKYPESWYANNAYAEALIAQRNYARATSYIEKAQRANPENHEIWNNLGLIYLHAGNYPQARRSFENAMKLKKNYAASYTNLGNVYWHQQNYQLAREYYTMALKYNPDDFNAQNNLGNYYFFHYDFAKAAEYYKKAIEINPHHAEGFSNLANLYDKLKKYDLAERYFARAIEINPDNANFYLYLSEVKSKLNKTEEAQELYQLYLEKQKKD